MTATLLVRRDDVRVYHAAWAELLDALPRRDDGTVCDALIVDAPYSERTHAGHDDGAATANRALDYAQRQAETVDPSRRWQARHALKGRGERQRLSYAAWTDDDVAEFVAAWAPVTRGWIVSLTDHVLAASWEGALTEADRYVFAPLACVEPGSRVRMVGDGPSNWSCWSIAARPRTREMQRWGTLPGAYVVPPGEASARAYRSGVVGGKPLWLMERLVEDYSRPGDLVCDPCCGAGTTLLAALRTGRVAVGGDAMREHAEIAAERCGRRMVQRPLFGGAA